MKSGHTGSWEKSCRVNRLVRIGSFSRALRLLRECGCAPCREWADLIEDGRSARKARRKVTR